MTTPLCPHETEVFELVSIGQWPRQADASLTAHVAQCAMCTDVVVVAAAFRAVDDVDVTPSLPDAGAVWQKAQWQARQDAVRRATFPVAAAQAITAFAVIAAVIVAAAWLLNDVSWTGLAAAVGERAVALIDAPASWMSQASDSPRSEITPGLLWAIGAVALASATVVGLAAGLTSLADLQSEPPASRR
jgi:hypothetical protein